MEQIIYFIPIYEKNIGSVTRVMTENEEETTVNMKCKSYFNRLCRSYTVDSLASKSKYGKIIGGINCIPIPLSGDMLLIPVKVRKPMVKSDGAMGYVNFHQIKDCTEGKTGDVHLTFKNSTKLRIISSYKTLQKTIRDASIINDHYRKEKGIIRYADLNEPITRAELTLLARLLLNLKNTLNID